MAYCNWGNTSELNLKYHDTEWGIPLWDDRGQFEFLMMEVMQCGLNWSRRIKLKKEWLKSICSKYDHKFGCKFWEKYLEKNAKGGV